MARPRARYALLVGVSDYPSLPGPAKAQSKLPGVRKDIENMEQTLLALGWDRRGIHTLLDAQASGSKVRGHFKGFQAAVQKDDLVLVFISGHGAPKEYSLSGFGRPLLADDTGDNDPSTLDFWEVQSLVRNLACDRAVLVIDTCHAGGAANKLVAVEVSSTGMTAAPGLSGPSGSAMIKMGDPNKHLAVVTASNANEVSGDTAQGGVFTLAFLDALRRSRGALPLGQVIAQQVAPQVIRDTREHCRRQGAQCKYPQQTPALHHTGRGDQILL